MENKMENCKFGLNGHKPFINNKDTHHHEHHNHEQEHEHHEHTHDHRGTDKKVLKWALSITLITMFLEFFYQIH